MEEATKIRIAYLEALERGDYGVLPGVVYAIGFLRSYARFLGLDADALVDRYRKISGIAEQPEVPVPQGTGIKLWGQSRIGRVFLVMAVIGLLLAGISLVYRFL